MASLADVLISRRANQQTCRSAEGQIAVLGEAGSLAAGNIEGAENTVGPENTVALGESPRLAA